MRGTTDITRLLRAIQTNPNRPVSLVCHADGIFSYQNPRRLPTVPGGPLLAEKRDLDILHLLGLVPGDTRPARDLLRRLIGTITSARAICGGCGSRAAAWRPCPRAAPDLYAKGIAAGLDSIIIPRPNDDKERTKHSSVMKIMKAGRLLIRPHHLLCLACFHRGRSSFEMIAEDNLGEILARMQANPALPVTLVRGCCMICPPCSAYDKANHVCVGYNAMSLRDQKRDLDVLHRLDLAYGATLPAAELLRRIFRAVRSLQEVCGFGDNVVRGPEWTICGAGNKPDSYQRAKRRGMGIALRS